MKYMTMKTKSRIWLTLVILGLALAPLFSQVAHAQQPQAYVGAAEPQTAPEVYGQGVRETEWQSPAAEQRGFHLPPGFEIQLFASEPELAKPLNMAWDSRGRLWVSCTLEYPYPAKEGTRPRDSIKILEDSDGDGRADKFTTFAEELNIPMGLLPVADGVICFSIPHVWYLQDRDGDDHVDNRIQLLGPFDTTRDTHGMVSSLARGSDGWIYACHGFNNQSEVTATDGSSVSLHSGNTFRFRQDGSRIEHFTHGQVNPFGLTRDQWGNWYSADCHSKPLTALLPGAYYPSFGRPDDGLGFAPDMMQHLHGSTAICGLEYYQAEQFPAAYRRLFYSGNVMTSRINCNAPSWRGATINAVEQADFMTSDDPWFRPVDIQLGADGALFVADFYNKIIGHYEVPLEHPGRDRESGRIWRIAYRGDSASLPVVSSERQTTLPLQPPDIVRDTARNSAASSRHAELAAGPLAGLDDVLVRLGSTNISSRRQAIELCLARMQDKASEVPADTLESLVGDASQPLPLRQSGLELLQRLGLLEPQLLVRLIHESPAELQTLAIWLAREQPPALRQELLSHVRLRNTPMDDPQVRKVAIEFMGLAGEAEDIDGLLSTAKSQRESDPMLAHAARIAARDLLLQDTLLADITADWLGKNASANSIPMDHELASELADLLPAVDSAAAAQALLSFLSTRGEQLSKQQLEQAIALASNHVQEQNAAELLAAVDLLTDGEVIARSELLQRIVDRCYARNVELGTTLREYGRQLQADLLSDLKQRIIQNGPSMDWVDETGAGWGREERQCTDGQSARLLSSLSRSEQTTGSLRSEAFDCPSALSFWLAGHNGFPQAEDHRKNFVRLVLVSTGQQLQQSFPPRNDVAVQVQWDLTRWLGQSVRLELVDQDADNAYAWLAAGRFSMPELEQSQIDQSLAAVSGLLQRGIESGQLENELQLLKLSPRQMAKLVSAGLQGRSQQPLSTLVAQAIRVGRPELVGSHLAQPWLT